MSELYYIETTCNDVDKLIEYLGKNNIIVKFKLYDRESPDILIYCNESIIKTLDVNYNVFITKYSDLRCKL